MALFLFYATMYRSLIPQRLYAGIDSFPLMAIPFFILALELMNCAGLTDGYGKGRFRGCRFSRGHGCFVGHRAHDPTQHHNGHLWLHDGSVDSSAIRWRHNSRTSCRSRAHGVQPFLSAKRGIRGQKEPYAKESVKDIPPSLTALAMPAVILGNPLRRVHANEAAAVAVVYAFVVAVWKRTLSAKDLVPMLGRTCSTVGMILLVMGAASISQPAAS